MFTGVLVIKIMLYLWYQRESFKCVAPQFIHAIAKIKILKG